MHGDAPLVLHDCRDRDPGDEDQPNDWEDKFKMLTPTESKVTP